MPDRVVLMICLAFTLAGCAMPLRCGPEAAAAPSSADATLDGRLVRCSALGEKAHGDPDCESTFAEARQRILPPTSEKQP